MKRAILICRARTNASKKLLSVHENILKEVAEQNDFDIIDSITFIGEDSKYYEELEKIVRRISLKEADHVILENPQCISNDPNRIADFLLSVKSSGGKTVFRKYYPIWR